MQADSRRQRYDTPILGIGARVRLAAPHTKGACPFQHDPSLSRMRAALLSAWKSSIRTSSRRACWILYILFFEEDEDAIARRTPSPCIVSPRARRSLLKRFHQRPSRRAPNISNVSRQVPAEQRLDDTRGG